MSEPTTDRQELVNAIAIAARRLVEASRALERAHPDCRVRFAAFDEGAHLDVDIVQCLRPTVIV